MCDGPFAGNRSWLRRGGLRSLLIPALLLLGGGSVCAVGYHPAVFRVLPHQGAVREVAFCPDGSLVATTAEDGPLRVWDTRTGKLLHLLPEGGRSPAAVRCSSILFSPDGQQVRALVEPGVCERWNPSTGVSLGREWLPGAARNPIASSPDGVRMAGACSGPVRLFVWDTRTRKTLELPTPGQPIASLIFSPDGTRLASGSMSGMVQVWDVETGTRLDRWDEFPVDVTMVAFSPDGTRIAAANRNKVEVREVGTHRLIQTWQEPACSIAYSPDGRFLATGDEDGPICIRDTARGELKAELRGHLGKVSSLAFSPDGSTLASASEDNTARLWDLRLVLAPLQAVRPVIPSPPHSPGARTAAAGPAAPHPDIRVTQSLLPPASPSEVQVYGELPEPAVQAGHQGQIRSLAFSPDGRWLASAASDKQIRLWDASSGEEVRTLHVSAVVGLTFFPDGRMLEGIDANGHRGLWDLQTGLFDNRLGDVIAGSSPVLSPDGRTIAASGSRETVRLQDAATGTVTYWLTVSRDAVICYAFSPDSKLLATGDEDSNVKLWDVRTGELILTFGSGPTDSLTESMQALWVASGNLRDTVRSVTFSPDGQRLASGHQRGTAKIWELHSRRLIDVFRPGRGDVWTVKFSPDGQTLATGCDSGVDLWNCGSGKWLRALTPGAHVLAFSPDGERLATDRGLVFDVKTGALLWRMNHTSPVTAVCSIPRRIGVPPLAAAGYEDGSVRLWDTASGELRDLLAGQTAAVHTLAASRDGLILAAGSDDRTIRLWDTRTGRLLRALTGHGAPLSRVSFSPDGKLLVSGDSEGMILLWDVPHGVLLDHWDLWPQERLAVRLKQILQFGDHMSPVYPVFSPDGKDLLIGSDKKLERWDFRTRRLKVTYPELNGVSGPMDLVVSPDGNSVAAGSGWGVQVWDARAGAVRWNTFEQFSIGSLAFSPDGKSLAGLYPGHAARIWNAQTGEIQQVLTCRNPPGQVAAFSEDGRQVYTGGVDGCLRTWNRDTGKLLAAAMGLDGGKEWLCSTPEGFFDSSARAADLVKWKFAGSLYAAESYLRRFRRPDLLRKALAGQSLPAPAVSIQDIPPSVRFIRLQEAGGVRGRAVMVTLEAYGCHDPRELELQVNGRPLPPGAAAPVEANSIPISRDPLPLTAGGRPIFVDARPIWIAGKAIEIRPRPIWIAGKSTPPAFGSVPEGNPMAEYPVDAGSGGSAINSLYQSARRFTFRIRLPPGAPDVRLRAVAYDTTNLGSAPAEIILQNTGQRPVPGNLYVLCVGISRYKYGSMLQGKRRDAGAADCFPNLQYPSLDAKAVARRWQQEGKPLYLHSTVHLLTDEQVTLESLRTELKWLQRSVRPGQVDTVVIFLSGHGISDGRGHYCFPTYNFQSGDLAHTTLSGGELEQALGGKLQARAVFLLADTCHSGTLAEGRSDDLDLQLSRSGVYVLASSSRYAYESPLWGHGAFTTALLRALSRKDLAIGGVIPFHRLAGGVGEELALLMKSAGGGASSEAPVAPLEGKSVLIPVAQPR